ncbi:protein SIEL isoform X1 [Rhododendron vialii]|uniref:protein SIEL isoform X1 n=1 Tax=Rhododendron vialii TaxID=182163 RepID=UPI00265EA40B|nr:protein SIEL isoform X1 [Rhododendron vialii]
MEEQIRANCYHLLPSSTAVSASAPPQALILSLSLILNPSTSDSTLSSLLQTLTLSLHHSHLPSLSLLPTLSILSTLASHHPHLSRPIFHSIRSLSLTSPRALAASLSVLASLAESDQTLLPELSEFSETLFLTLCFKPSVSVRHWALMNAERLRIRPHLLVTVLLGFTRDPYPYLRAVALDGLVGLCKSIVVEDRELVETSCCRAVELFSDMEDCVRCAAVRAVAQWGQLLVALNHDSNRKNLSDALFLQLCSMVRDMSLKVRVEAFDALGEISMVSEEILLQTLSKKLLSVSLQGSKLTLQRLGLKEKTCSGLCSTKPFEIPASNSAGVFVHGLEDEFSEVRRSACHSLHTLSILSADFSGEALNLLVDVLNDDSMVVRLQALETLRCMALFDRLKVQEAHMHMFLSTLVDDGAVVRSAARKVLRIIRLEDVSIFKLCVDGLLENLEMYPQDEADVFSVLLSIGQHHGNFAADVIVGVSDEIEPCCDGKLVFDGGRVAALLVLAISAPLSHEKQTFSIPPRIFSYAVTLLGRISNALSDVMDQDTLLAYLSHCSSSTIISSGEFDYKGKELFLPVEDGSTNNPIYEKSCSADMQLQKLNVGASGSHCQKMGETRKVVKALLNYQVEDHGEVIKSVEFMLEKVKDIWQLIQVGYTGEVLQTLRRWKEELAKFPTSSSAGAFAFSLQHLRIAKLLAKLWPHFISPRKLSCGMGELGLLLGKLDRTIKEMKYRFMGLSKQDELHVLELILLNFVLRLSSIEAFSDGSTLKKLHSTLSQIESLSSELSMEPSKFVSELKKSLHEIGFSADGPFYGPLLFRKSVEIFSLKQFVFSVKLKHIKAELDVSGNDYDKPFPFIPGLPVGIRLGITLYNISRENRLWLRLAVDDDLSEFVYLDFDQFGGNSQIRKFIFDAPFYKTLKANSFTVKVCLGLECLSENVQSFKSCGGPKQELVYLCKQKEVFLSTVVKE